MGWAEELRPFTGAQPLVLLLALVASALLIIAAWRIAAERDVGSGLLRARDTAAPRYALLSSPTAQALRSEWTSLIVWLASVGAFAFIVGVISKSISSAGISKQLERELEKLGSGSVLTPTGYIGFSFIFFVLATSLFAVSQVAAARHEEADERLETLLAQPVARTRWLGGRLALASVATAAVSLLAGLLAWAGAASQGVSISFPKMIEAGANCLPVALLFLGIAALAYGLVPRATAGSHTASSPSPSSGSSSARFWARRSGSSTRRRLLTSGSSPRSRSEVARQRSWSRLACSPGLSRWSSSGDAT